MKRIFLILSFLVSLTSISQTKPIIKVGLFENYIRVVDTSNNVLMDNPKDYIIIRKHYLHSNTYSFYYKYGSQNRADEGIDLTYVPIENISPLNMEFIANDHESFEEWYSKELVGSFNNQVLIKHEDGTYTGTSTTYNVGSLQIAENETITGIILPDAANDDRYIVYFENGTLKYKKYN